MMYLWWRTRNSQNSGIGLSNLNSRWQIIVGQEIEIIDTADSFQVRLPLTKPKSL